MSNDLLTANRFHGLGVETTRGTAVVPGYYLPIETPQWTPKLGMLEDKGLRGSPVDLYGDQPGVRHDEWDCKGNAFLDTFPNYLRAILGSTDTVVAAAAATTLAAGPSAGALTISTVATIPVGSVIVIDVIGSSLSETHVTTAVSGAGPFTVTLSTQLSLAHASGVAVTPLTSHAIGLVNAVALGSQPPSYTLVDFDTTLGAGTARQLTNAMLSDLSLSFAVAAPLSYTAKWMTNPAATVAAPTNTYTGELFAPAWACTVAVAQVPSVVVVDGTCDLKRAVEAIHTTGQQAPHSIFAAPLSVSGKIVFVYESGDTTVTNALKRQTQVVDLLLTEPTTGHLIDLRMSQVQLIDPKITPGKANVEVEAMYKAEANTTDAVNGGYSPIKSYCGSAIAVAY